MIHTQNTKIVPIILPQAIVDNDDPVGAYGDTNPVSVDTRGWDYCDIYVMLGATDIDMTALAVYEGDVAASGADDADFSAIEALTTSGSTGLGRIPQDDDGGKVFHFGAALNQGRKRYLALDATCGNGSAGTYIVAWAVLSRANETPKNAAERGCAGELIA